MVLLTVGLGVLIATFGSFDDAGASGDAAGAVAVRAATAGVNVAVLIVAVLGALIITAEYSTGMIRSTFAAVPRRTGAMAAKAAVLGVTTFAATAVAIWATAFAIWPILSGDGVSVQLGAASVIGPLFGGALYVAMIALLAFGFGTILRSTAGGLATVLGLMMVAPLIIQLLAGLSGADWVADIGALLPQNAGSLLYAYGDQAAMATTGTGGLDLTAWGGFAVLVCWDAVILAIAFVQVRRRDA